MKCDQVGALDGANRCRRGQVSPGVPPVKQLSEFPKSVAGGIVGNAAEVFDRQVFGQLQLFLFEGRVRKDLRKDVESFRPVLFQGGEVCQAHVRFHRNLKGNPVKREGIVDFAARHRPGAPGPHRPRRQPGKAGFTIRVVSGAGPENDGNVDQRQFMIFEEVQDDAVVHDQALRLGRGEGKRLEGEPVRRRCRGGIMRR